VSPAAPPGRYELAVTVYDPDTGVTYPAEEPFFLGQVEVVRPPDPIPPARVGVGHRLAAVGGGLEIFGYELPSRQWTVGERLPVTVWLRVRRSPVTASSVRLELVDRRGRPVATHEVRLGTADDPALDWLVGDLRRLALAVDLPPEEGRYVLRLAVIAGDDSLVLRRGLLPVERVWLRWLDVTAPARRTAVPEMGYRTDLPVGETIELLGYDLDVESVTPGADILVTLYWRALARNTTSFRVTVQMAPAGIEEPSGALVPRGEPVAQHDGLPAEGTRPTAGWLPGEVITDRHELALPSDLAAGDYLLIAALYDPDDPASPRPPVEQDGRRQDYVLLQGLIVAPPPPPPADSAGG